MGYVEQCPVQPFCSLYTETSVLKFEKKVSKKHCWFSQAILPMSDSVNIYHAEPHVVELVRQIIRQWDKRTSHPYVKMQTHIFRHFIHWEADFFKKEKSLTKTVSQSFCSTM